MADGDLVQFKGSYWKVLSGDTGVRTVTLQSWEDELLEIPDDDPNLRMLSKPGQWPFVLAPRVPLKAKRPRRLVRVVQGHTIDLIPFCEWSPTGLLQLGGPIFLSPSLRLRPGETLVLHYDNGIVSRLAITPSFGSAAQRRRRLVKKVKDPTTAWDLLDSEDD